MDSYDLKAILGEKLRRLTDKTLKALVDCMCTVGASLCSLDKRVSALESVEIPEGGYKPMQEPVASPSASGTAIQFIESASQDAAGRMTMTKKTVRTGSTSQTGVVQLEDSHSSTSTTKAATPNSVKEAYDLANTANSELANKQDKPSSATENNIATFNGTKSTKDSGKAFLPSTSTWDGTSDDKVPTAKAVQAKLDEKQELLGISQTGNALKFLNEQGSFVESPAMVNVTTFTSYSDISAVISEKSIPYYVHTDTPIVVNLIYAGVSTPTGPGQVAKYLFVGVAGNTVYSTSFSSGASSFGEVYEFPLFGKDYVLGSSDTSSWSSDDTNVPTRAAVESKISSAMSGSLGGFIGPMSPNDLSLYQISGHTFLKGDWFVVSESGTAYYYPNNDRSASAITLNMLEGEEYYWTTSGTFVKKPSTSLQIYAITNLSDWNDLENTGLYQIASQASNVQNSPSTGNCVCYVCEVNGAVVQFVISPNHLYKRYRGGSGSGQWGSWMAVDNIEIIVGTTSFNDLKALYGMTKNLVAVSSETVSSNNYTTLFALVSVKLSGSTPTEFIFERSCPHSAGQVGQVEQKICTSSGWSSALLNVKYSETSGTATNYNENVGSIKTALDGKIGRTPVGISSGSGVTNGAFFGAVLLIVLPSISDYPYNLGGNGMYISLKSFIEWAVGNTYKMQKGQIYMILNNRGGTVRLYKGTSTDSEYVSLDNDRIAFLGCWGLAVGTEYFLQKG